MDSPGSQIQANQEEEILFDRAAIRTMAKDIRSLLETSTSEKKEVFLEIETPKNEIKKANFDFEEKKENDKLLKEKQKIQNIIKSLNLIYIKQGDGVLNNKISVTEEKEGNNLIEVQTQIKVEDAPFPNQINNLSKESPTGVLKDGLDDSLKEDILSSTENNVIERKPQEIVPSLEIIETSDTLKQEDQDVKQAIPPLEVALVDNALEEVVGKREISIKEALLADLNNDKGEEPSEVALVDNVLPSSSEIVETSDTLKQEDQDAKQIISPSEVALVDNAAEEINKQIFKELKDLNVELEKEEEATSQSEEVQVAEELEELPGEIKEDLVVKEIKEETAEEKIENIEKEIEEVENKKALIKEKSIPFEKNIEKALIEIDKIKEEIKNIKKEEREINKKKQELEAEEEGAGEENKRMIEKQRWEIEKERDTLEQKRYSKEDEFKSVKLQLKEIELKLDEFKKEITDLDEENSKLQKQKLNISLLEEKDSLLEKLNKLSNIYEETKENLFKNNEEKDLINHEYENIIQRENGIEEEIKVFEKRNSETDDVIEKRRIEEDRREKELLRRDAERERWQIEDKIKTLKEKREKIKKNYRELTEEKENLERRIKEIENQIS